MASFSDMFDRMRRRILPRARGRTEPPENERGMRVVRLDDSIDRIYAIGDVHGRFDLLKELSSRIQADIEAQRYTARVILLGDMIDRGPQSAHVLDWLVKEGVEGGASAICGNHERMMLNFLDGADDGKMWLSNGGIETLASYGAYGERLNALNASSRAVSQALQASLPRSHERLLRGLPDAFLWRDFILAHDIIDADHAMAAEPVTGSATDDEVRAPGPIRIVHGHRRVDEPYHDERVVSIDTGAYATGRLTCAVLGSESISFVSAGRHISRE